MDPFNYYILDESNTDILVLRGGGFCTPLADSKLKYDLLLSHEQGKKKAVSPCGIPEDEVCEKTAQTETSRFRVLLVLSTFRSPCHNNI